MIQNPDLLDDSYPDMLERMLRLKLLMLQWVCIIPIKSFKMRFAFHKHIYTLAQKHKV
jgi:hypothetical protein